MVYLLVKHWIKYGTIIEIFGDFPSKDFPLMAKIVDAAAPLSIHVHPDDSYAYEHEEGQYGKSECWYIIEADEGAKITIGTYAKSRDEFEEQLEQGTFENYLRTIQVQPGDFTLYQLERYIP